MQKSEITTINTSEMSPGLLRLHDIPKQLYLKGNQELLAKKPRVGIVGARKHSAYGRDVTSQLASDLAREGVTIVSGLAFGIDSIAHEAAVKAGGKTIAVLPCGIDTIYPANHTNLGKQILEKDGLLISEYEGKGLPMAHQFLERNRIIAALSDILIVTEAATRSGSLNTARWALDMGITVMAVPGNISSPYSSGTNRLIQAGAAPILSAQDVLNELGIKQADKQAYLPENEAEDAILASIKEGVSQSDELLRHCGLDVNIFQTHITMLEIKGILQAQAGYWSIK